jgi:hypothetical protein
MRETIRFPWRVRAEVALVGLRTLWRKFHLDS